MTQIELLSLLQRCSAAIAAAREWVPATAPEIVQLNSADDEIRRQMARIQLPQAPAPAPFVSLSGNRDLD